MKALRWLYERAGELVCFGLGFGCALEAADEGGTLTAGLAACALLFTGLGLRAIRTRRNLSN